MLLITMIPQHDPDADKNKFRTLIPSFEGMGRAKAAYVAYVWVPVQAHRKVEVDEELPAEIPKGFLGAATGVFGLCEERKGRRQESGRGNPERVLYMVVTYDVPGYCGRELDVWEDQ
jgi:hypothetical protein